MRRIQRAAGEERRGARHLASHARRPPQRGKACAPPQADGARASRRAGTPSALLSALALVCDTSSSPRRARDATVCLEHATHAGTHESLSFSGPSAAATARRTGGQISGCSISSSRGAQTCRLDAMRAALREHKGGSPTAALAAPSRGLPSRRRCHRRRLPLAALRLAASARRCSVQRVQSVRSLCQLVRPRGMSRAR